jgi:hypothetical protein
MMAEDIDLRQRAIERIKIGEMMQKFRICAAKRQAEFYKVSHGRFPKVTKQTVEEGAERLLGEWKLRQKRALPQSNIREEIILSEFSSSSDKLKGDFECPRCLKKFRDHRKYSSHITSHYSGNGESRNAALMAQVGDGRGLERSTRSMSDAEREDRQYFINDVYQ